MSHCGDLDRKRRSQIGDLIGLASVVLLIGCKVEVPVMAVECGDLRLPVSLWIRADWSRNDGESRCSMEGCGKDRYRHFLRVWCSLTRPVVMTDLKIAPDPFVDVNCDQIQLRSESGTS